MNIYKKWYIASFLLLISLVVGFIVFVVFFANGKIDPFYLRFTTKKQHSLVIGSSRAAQGIIPSLVNKSGLQFDGPLYNFGFAGTISPYGPVYYNAIKKKVDTGKKNGLFLIEISPKAIAYQYVKNSEQDTTKFRENGCILEKMNNFNVKPNFEYLFKHYEKAYYNIILAQFKKNEFLHDDGWLEITCRMDKKNTDRRLKKTVRKTKREFTTKFTFSSVRYDYLKQIITYLADYGEVYLVRIPTSPQMYELEKELMPDFNDKMMDLTRTLPVRYINIVELSKEYKTTDGNHLYKDYSRKATNVLIEKLREMRR